MLDNGLYPKNKIINYNKTKEFLNNQWDKDYGNGLYFSAFHELGENLFIPINIDNKNYFAAHALYDGFSLLGELDKTHQLGIKTEKSRTSPKPRFFQWIKPLISVLASKPVEELKFKKARIENLKSDKYQYLTLKIDPEKMIDNSTGHVLNQVSKLFTKHLTTNKFTRWMIPVSIRDHIKPAPKSDLCASYLGVNCSLLESSEQTQQNLIRKLKRGEYWGYWLI